MGSLRKKTYTKPLPAGAELFERKGQTFARWKDSRGKTRTASVTEGKDGSDRIIVESAKWLAKYRDGSGIVREVWRQLLLRLRRPRKERRQPLLRLLPRIPRTLNHMTRIRIASSFRLRLFSGMIRTLGSVKQSPKKPRRMQERSSLRSKVL